MLCAYCRGITVSHESYMCGSCRKARDWKPDRKPKKKARTKSNHLRID